MARRVGTAVQGTTTDGRIRLSEEHRAHLSAKLKERWANLSPEEQAAQLARLRSGATGRAAPAIAEPSPVSEPPAGGSRSPLDDAPRAPQGRLARPDLGGRPRVAPLFVVPDLPPIEAGGDGIGGQAGGPELEEFGAPPAALTQAQVATLVRFPFAFVALRRGSHWKLRDDETDMLAEPLARKLSEHAVVARGLAAGGDWVVIGGSLALILMSRLEEDSRHGDKRAAGGPGDGPGPGGLPPEHARPPVGVPDLGPPGSGLGTLNGFVLAPQRAGAPAPQDARGLPPPDPGHPDDAPL